jgi:integrase
MQGFSRDRINKVAYTMQSLFEQAIDDGLIATNPAKRLKRPVSEDGTHRAITDAERKVILQVAETHPYGLWVKLMLYCGLRPAETAALVWSNIDLKNNRLHITQALKKNGSIGMPKSKAGVRAVPIPNTLRDELARHFGSPFFYVFCNRNNSCLIHRNMQTMWNSFKREMNISMGCKVYRNEVLPPYWVADDLSPYCLRHTYCTDLQSAGVPINVAKELWPGFQQNQKPSNS